jgi:4-alpha-glucanotransferase
MNISRASGILMHVTSLPSKFGIGDLGNEAFEFADALARARQDYWQVLPVNPTSDIGHSPYSGLSAFAGDPLLISPQRLYRHGLLDHDPTRNLPDLPADRVDFGRVIGLKWKFLDAAYTAFLAAADDPGYHRFCIDHVNWLDDYALFITIRYVCGAGDWSRWPKGLRDRRPDSLRKFRLEHHADIERHKFLQYQFFRQWSFLKSYCNEHGIRLIGDLPLYLAHDSADVWAHPRFFELNRRGRPLFISGMPPDMYSPTGQRWGHPVYNWAALRKAGYAWWLDRIGHNLKLFDVLRLDHFRGFVAFYRIPAGNKTAARGRWVRAPSVDFFRTVFERFPSCPLIVEDLGRITPAVTRVIDKWDLTGMRIAQFGLPFDDEENIHSPENYPENCVAYTGTHDNNTLGGWFDNELSDEQRSQIRAYLQKQGSSDELRWPLIRLLMDSKANLTVVPVQDVLGLGGDARMNLPASVGESNWTWRLRPGALTDDIIDKLAGLTRRTQRTSK